MKFWRPRFSVRIILVIVCVACISLGILSNWSARASKQRRATEWAKQKGAIVIAFDYQITQSGWDSDKPNPYPDWLMKIANVHFFASIERVEFSQGTTYYIDPPAPPELKIPMIDCEKLTGFSGIKVLRLQNIPLENFEALGSLTELETLWLNDTLISDLTPLRKLSKMEALWLSDNPISDLRPIGALTELRALWLENTKVDDIKPLASLTHLRQLDLEGTRVNDLSPLASCKSLYALNVENTNVEDISPLFGIYTLEEIYLGNTKVPAKQVNQLKSLNPNCSVFVKLRKN